MSKSSEPKCRKSKSVDFDKLVRSESGNFYDLDKDNRTFQDRRMGTSSEHTFDNPEERWFTREEMKQIEKSGRLEVSRDKFNKMLEKWKIMKVNDDGTFQLCGAGMCIVVALIGWTALSKVGLVGGKRYTRRVGKNKRNTYRKH